MSSDHGHAHDDDHEHGHDHAGRWARVWHAVGPHSHDHDRAVDPVLENSAERLRVLRISLAGLAATALAQAAVVALSGSALTEPAEATLRATPGVLAAGRVRLRWVGRTLRAECEISVDPACSIVQAHDVAVSAEHALLHAIPRLAAASVHADPMDGADHHAVLAGHPGA